MKTISFRDYLKRKGYTATKIWKTSEAFYAYVNTTPNIDGFTNIDKNSKMVRLSFKDVNNSNIVGPDVNVVESVKLKEMIQQIIREVEDEEIEESNVTGNIDGYQTPFAFGKPENEKKKGKRMADIVGYTQVNEAVKVGKRYGEWAVTQYVPVTYDDLGSANGGVIKLVNQDTMETLIIQNDLALRGSKWWISTKGKRVQNPNPETVISNAIKLNEDKSWKRFLDPYIWFRDSKESFKYRYKNVHPSVIEQLIKITEKNGDDIERGGKNNVWGFDEESGEDNQALWQYMDGSLYYVNPQYKSKYDTIIPKLIRTQSENINEGTNRYHQLRKDEGTPNQKIGKGIREMRKQIQEMEKFLEWYGRIKTENDLDSTQYWKRTQKHLNVIRERLTKISEKIRNLSV